MGGKICPPSKIELLHNQQLNKNRHLLINGCHSCPTIHENRPFHGREVQNPAPIHKIRPFHGREVLNPAPIHENRLFHGREVQNPAPIHEICLFHGRQPGSGLLAYLSPAFPCQVCWFRSVFARLFSLSVSGLQILREA